MCSVDQQPLYPQKKTSSCAKNRMACQAAGKLAQGACLADFPMKAAPSYLGPGPGRDDSRVSPRSPSQVLVLTPSLVGVLGSPTKIDYRKKREEPSESRARR